MAAEQTAIRSLLVPMQDGYLLMPGALVAEVVSYAAPEAVPGQYPQWFLGKFNWRGQRLPCVSFEGMNGGPPVTPATRARIIVMKGVNNRPGLPYFALVSQGIPRLLSVEDDVVEALDESMDDAPAVRMPVLVHGEPAFIPDVEYMEDQVYRALFG
ncbi:MAG: chemotaxis protein CheW [Ectothiorhodospiraceae bacterium]|nr:chemotaxis protein CheW [Ectothiorhodospiraceae bacterium]